MSENGADPLALYRKVNVEGTRVLLEESIAAGVKAFIFASSVKAVGEMSRHPWTEATASPVPQDPYGISKLEAEQLILARVRGGDMHAPSLRFPMMYGPEMKGNLLRLMSWINRGLPVPVGSSATRRSFLYVDNAVAAIEALIDTPLCLQAPFFASDGQDLSTVELVTLIAAALGKAPRVLRLPAIATRLSLAEATGRFVPFGRNINSAMHRLTDSLQVDPAALRNAVGYAPTVSVERGIGATAEWFQSTQQDR
jgi:nucleoside-diphosphate-sugar epimerase